MSILKGIAEITVLNSDGSTASYTKEENMITNSVKNLLDIKSSYFRGDATLNHETCLIGLMPILQMYSGILLFQDPLTENANNIFPPIDNPQIGHAGEYYSGTNPQRGTLNASSGAVTGGYKYVWDFATDRANGSISAIALTSKFGGNIGIDSSSESSILANDCLYSSLNNSTSFSVGYGSFLTTSSTYSSYYIQSYNPSTDTFTLAKTSAGTTTVYWSQIRRPSTFGLQTSEAIINGNINTLATTNKIASAQYWFTDSDYIYSTYLLTANTLALVKFDYNMNKITDSVITLSSSNVMYASSTILGGYLDGYLYVWCRDYTTNTNSKIIKVDINTGDFTTIFTVSSTSINYVSKINDYLCFSYSGTASSWYYLVKGNTVKKVYNYTCHNNITRVIPNSSLSAPQLMFSSYSSYPRATIGYFTPCLSTINNLSTPVAKSSTQTMQISYTILET